MLWDTANLRKHAMEIFQAGLKAADPKVAVHRFMQRKEQTLFVDKQTYDLDNFENVFVVGCGKASAAMAVAIEEILADKISGGFVNVKYGHTEDLKKIRLNEAGHPVPDATGLAGSQQIVALLQKTGTSDLVICLISGGGSALLPLPADGISLEEKQIITEKLLTCGAAIDEINAVRKHISKIKGGQLAKFAHPAALLTLILSDVVGDALDAIASGPSVPDSSTFEDVKEILDRREIWAAAPESIKLRIKKGLDGQTPETPKAGETIFAKTQTVVIGSNIQAVESAHQKAQELGYNSLILSSSIEGETKDVARVHAGIAKEILKTGNPVPPPACVISGGETTVTIRGDGKGGRNQEFVLAAAIDIVGLEPAVIFSAGTDGTDGPTDAAGAICDGQSVHRAEQKKLSAVTHLQNNNAYPFFQKLDDLVMTGPTKTNVMDLRLILVGDLDE